MLVTAVVLDVVAADEVTGLVTGVSIRAVRAVVVVIVVVVVIW